VKAALVSCEPWMPFCLSSGQRELIHLEATLSDQGKDFTSNVAPEASDDLRLRMAFCDALYHVSFCACAGA
jgi:hypothetical protein